MARKSKTPEFKVGDKVAYSVQWLRSVGMVHTPYAHARGVVTDTKPFGGAVLVSIDWKAWRRCSPCARGQPRACRAQLAICGVLIMPRSRDPRMANIRATLRAYRTHSWRAMIATPSGKYVWPCPGDSALPGEVLLAPYESGDGPSWDESTLIRALDRAGAS